MVVRVKSVGGSFIASNSTSIVDMLSAPAAQRGNKLLGVNFVGLDAQNNNDRCVLGLSMGKFDVGRTVETGGHRTVNIGDPFAAADFLNVIATGVVTGGATNGGPPGMNHYVPLHGLVVVEQIDVLVFLPDNTTDLQWFCELWYEPVSMSAKAWRELRHRPSVEHGTIGTVTV